MAQLSTTLPGTRIRQRRLELGLKQADVARRVKMSASYLNLIEHNRRRIAGEKLGALAQVLETTTQALSEGAEAALVVGLQSASARLDAPVEAGRAHELAERFPGWAAAVTEQAARIGELEATIGALSDRLAHNPHLAASLHDMISTVTAIQSSASILTETPDIEPQWRNRFQRNIFEESARLVESAGRLTSFLGPDAGAGDQPRSPQEEFESFLDHHGHRFPGLEDGLVDPEDLIAGSRDLASQSARGLAARFLERYRADASSLPSSRLGAALRAEGGNEADPGRVAAQLGLPIALVLRRMGARLEQGEARQGLAIADGSGALTYARPAPGFQMPRLGHGCPLWPLYRALTRPGSPVRALVDMPGPTPMRFEAFAICELRPSGGFDTPPVAEATMLVRAVASSEAPANPVGPDCPICPRASCAARRAPSILAHGL